MTMENRVLVVLGLVVALVLPSSTSSEKKAKRKSPSFVLLGRSGRAVTTPGTGKGEMQNSRLKTSY